MSDDQCGQIYNGLFTLRFTRAHMNEILDSLSDEQMTHVPCEGGNHALWTMGHLALADDFFLQQIINADSQLPDTWMELFGWGHPCRTDASKFPPVTEVRAKFDAMRQRLVDWIASMSDSELDMETPEDWREFAPTRRALVSMVAMHESTHAGQLTVARKSLGLKPLNM